MDKQHYSLAEAFQRGIYTVESPSPEHDVCYNVRIYPPIHVEIPRAMQRELEDVQQKMTNSDRGKMAENEEALAALNRKYRLKPEIYGLTALLEYCNDSTNEIVHRTELIRSTREELYQAMRDYVEVITDARQRAVYQEVLRDQIDI
jgi:hypothetical protein